jgi:hypothetical protein
MTGIAVQGGVLSVVPPPPLPRQEGAEAASSFPPPPCILILVVRLCPAPVSGLCCGHRGSCSSSSCAAAAATVIPPTISIAEYVTPPPLPSMLESSVPPGQQTPSSLPSSLMTLANDVWHQPTACVLFDRASITAAAATVSARGVCLTLFFWALRHTCWARI